MLSAPDLNRQVRSDSPPVTVSSSGVSASRMTRRRRPKNPHGSNMHCSVCNAPARSYNFDAVSCESCKSFFRRNGLRINELECFGSGDCPIDPGSRKCCPACRMRRCLAVGMNPQLLLHYKPRSSKTDSRASSPSGSSLRDPRSPMTHSRSHSSDVSQEAPLDISHASAALPKIESAVLPKIETFEPSIAVAATAAHSPLHMLATVSSNEPADLSSGLLPSPLLPLLLPSPSASLAVAAISGLPVNDDPLSPDVLVTTRCVDIAGPGSLDSEVRVEWRRALLPGASEASSPAPTGASTSLALRSSINTKVHALSPDQMIALTAALTDCVRSFTQPLTPEDAATLPLRGYTTEDNLKYFDFLLKRLVKSFKLVPDFANLATDIQLKLVKGDLILLLKSLYSLLYDPMLAAVKLEVMNGPPRLIYNTDVLRSFERPELLGTAYSRYMAFLYLSRLELWAVFSGDRVLHFALIFLSLFALHRLTSHPDALAIVLPLHAKFVQFVKQHILATYANAPPRSLPAIDYGMLFGRTHAVLFANSPSPSPKSQQDSYGGVGFEPDPFPFPDTSGRPFERTLVDFAFRILDWLFAISDNGATRTAARRLDSLPAIPTLVHEAFTDSGADAQSPAAPQPPQS